jgi:segregation and condensation protein A
MSAILDQISHTQFCRFQQFFTHDEGKAGVVVTFLAILELVKESLIELVQAEPFAEIHVKMAG